MKALLRGVVQEVLEKEMTEPLGAAPRGSAQKAGKASGPAMQPGFGDAHGQGEATGTAGVQR